MWLGSSDEKFNERTFSFISFWFNFCYTIFLKTSLFAGCSFVEK